MARIPGVESIETNLSQIVTGPGQVVGAMVGVSNRGPAFERTLITNSDDLLRLFGDPDTSVSYLHHSALLYLQKGSILYVTRVHNGAVASSIEVFADGISGAGNGLFVVNAENPGTWGNNVYVRARDYDSSNDIFVLDVYETVNGNDVLVETWTVSRTAQLDGFGQQLYIEDRINGNSDYITVTDQPDNLGDLIYAVTGEVIGTGDGTTVAFSGTLANKPLQPDTITIDHPGGDQLTDDGFGGLSGTGGSGTINYTTGAFDITWDTAPANAADVTADYTYQPEFSLVGGSNGVTPTAGHINLGWELYRNTDEVHPELLIGAGVTDPVVQQRMTEVGEEILAIPILDAPADKLTGSNLRSWRLVTQNLNTSHGALYAPWGYYSDAFSGKTIPVPPSGAVAAEAVRVAQNFGRYEAVAGPDRGTLGGINSLLTKFDKATVAVLYDAQVNVIRDIPGVGVRIWGQKTLQTSADALDRLNVRWNVNEIRRSLKDYFEQFVFEINNETTRTRVTVGASDYLERRQSEGALTAFRVICDETNNTPQVIDSNELHVRIDLQPARVAEFIRFETVIERTGVSL